MIEDARGKASFDHEHVLRAALQSLPARWQQVLWYADMLQETPHVITPKDGAGPEGGISPHPASPNRTPQSLPRQGPGGELNEGATG
ncbi:hypothetical protein ACW0JT_06370 [Arthrobacter sp. SA17]